MNGYNAEYNGTQYEITHTHSFINYLGGYTIPVLGQDPGAGASKIRKRKTKVG
jgi:hypothetical protein